ncbi:MAG TPA: hypothetical protein DIS62_00655 [Candidatus Kerfeldbacteria bacterium]|nr:hypothetical protein [Candidatus Kerfeldbacteria bacterium]
MISSVAHFANTIIDRPGNIGVRTGKLIASHSQNGGTGICICRASNSGCRGYKYYSMGILGNLPRILNALRMYCFSRFDHRYWDIKLFEAFTSSLFKAVAEESPNIAHVWEVSPKIIRALRAIGLPVVLDVAIAPYTYVARLHSKGLAGHLTHSDRLMRLELEAFKEADLIIVPSAFVMDELGAAGIPVSKIRLIEFGVTIPELGTSIRRHRENISFGFVGVVNRRKGVDCLIDAWDSKLFADDELVLCGRLHPDIKRKIGLLKFASNVTLPGFINPLEYFGRCDVFVFPSWSEGSAKAVLEAMAFGLPVITTKSSGTVVRNGVDGFVVEPGDTAALRERMLWFKNNRAAIATMGESARKRACEFSWERYASRVMKVYEECLG